MYLDILGLKQNTHNDYQVQQIVYCPLICVSLEILVLKQNTHTDYQVQLTTLL